MRFYLILFVALALLASYGCSGKSKPTRVSGNTGNAASADPGQNGPVGLAGGPGAPADASKGKSKEDKEGESKEEDKESSGDEDKDEDSEESTSEEAAEKAPPKRRFDPTDRRRGQTGRPGMAGGASQTTPPPETKSGNSKAGDSEEKEEEKEEPKEEEKEPEEKIVTLYDRAVKAFAKDHDTEAFQYLYAHYLTDEEAIKNHPPQWFDGVKEPRVALRWGIGVVYNDGGYDGEPPVIGDPVGDGGGSGSGGNGRAGNSGRRGGGGGGDFGNSGGGGMTVQGGKRRRSTDRRGGSNQSTPNNNSEPARLPSETLEYYTGDFGELFVKRYEMRLPRKFYGSIMHAVSESASNSDDQADNEEEASQASQSRELPGGGDFGMLGGNSMAPPRNNRNGRNNQDSDEEYEADPTSLAPGLMMVGVGNKKQLLENAKSLNLDVLAIFDVKIRHSERRNGDTSTKSNTRLSLYSVKTGEAIDTDSKSLSNLAVASARDKDREDPVELELDKIFSNMADVKFKAQDLPASLNSDIAGKRYEFLLSKKYPNPLPVLVEIKYYVDAGLISKNNYFAACEQLLGDVEAQDLIDGNLKQKERALEKYLPGNYEVNLESGGEENFR